MISPLTRISAIENTEDLGGMVIIGAEENTLDEQKLQVLSIFGAQKVGDNKMRKSRYFVTPTG
jgi:hypothetical protein